MISLRPPLCALLLTVALARPASATDFSQPVLDLENKPVLLNEKPVTFARVVANALLSDEKGLDGAEKLKRFALAQKIFNATGDVELSDEERVLIKKQVETTYNSLVYARVIELLGGK